MTKDKDDEAVDGARIAAQILNKMPTASRERIMKAIENREPALSTKIQESLFDFNDIASLAPHGAQILIAAIEHTDLVLSLKLASPAVKEVLFSNMSDRKAALVKDDLAALPPTRKTDVEDAQRRVLAKLDELRTSGKIRTQSKNDLWV